MHTSADTPTRLVGAEYEIGKEYGLTTKPANLFFTESQHEGSIPSLTAIPKYIWYFGVFYLYLIMEEQKINPGHYLELMDRIHIVMMNVQDHLLEHPLTQKYKDVEKQIEDAQHNLWEAYQLIGQKDYENEIQNNTH